MGPVACSLSGITTDCIPPCPTHVPQVLLANQQHEWVAGEGIAQGWRVLPGPVEAQALANRGQLVLYLRCNSDPSKPGEQLRAWHGLTHAICGRRGGGHVRASVTAPWPRLSRAAHFSYSPHA